MNGEVRMAYRTNKKRGRKARKKAPAMRHGTEGLNIYTYSRFPEKIQDAFIDGYELAKDAWASDAYSAGTSTKTARERTNSYIRDTARPEKQRLLSAQTDAGKAFREGVRSGIRVVQEEVGAGRTAYGVRFNRKRRNNPVEVRDLAQKALDESGAKNYRRAKDWVRRKGTDRMRELLSASTKDGREFRDYLKKMRGFHDWASQMDREGAFTNPGGLRRRNAPSSRQKADVYAEAKRLGFGRSYVDKVAELREGARAAAPTSVNSLKRDHDRNAYWPVITAHGTHWHYTLKKQKRGWVTEFRRRDKQSARHYISRDNTASSKPTYYSTRNEAFRALLNHVTAGKHVPFKNPRSKRNPEAQRYKSGAYEVIIDGEGRFGGRPYTVKILDTSRGRHSRERLAYQGSAEFSSATEAKKWADSWVERRRRRR
jgi:hypothetical protein